MVHKAWCCLRRVPSCLSRLSVKTNPKVSWLKKRRFWPKLGTFRLQIQHSIEEMILCFFQGNRWNVKVTWEKHHLFWPKLDAPGLYLQSEFTDGHEMMHKTFSSTEVTHCSWRSSVKFEGLTWQTSLTRAERPWAASQEPYGAPLCSPFY